MNYLVSRACGASSALDSDRQDDFYSLKKAVRSFYETYSTNISANEAWHDRHAAAGYQLNKTLRSPGRPRFVIGGRQIDALQQRHFKWRAIAKNFEPLSLILTYFEAAA